MPKYSTAAAALLLSLLLTPVTRAGETASSTTPAEASAAAAPALVAAIDELRSALRDASGGLSISGFFDVNATARGVSLQDVAFGCFELGVTRAIGSRTEFTSAVVMNDSGAQLTVGLLDVRLSREAAPDQPDTLRLRIGRFDVPFGTDWRDYASKDRVGISAPLTTDSILDGGMNATGVNLAGSSGIADYSAFVLRDTAHTLTGGRLGLSSHGVSMGASLMQMNGAEDGGGNVVGLDAEARLRRVHVRAERVEREDANAAARVWGWHVTATATAFDGRHAKVTPFLRYDAVATRAADSRVPFDAADPRRRLTAGLNTSLASVLTFKLEYQRALRARSALTTGGPSDDSWLAQVVVGF